MDILFEHAVSNNMDPNFFHVHTHACYEIYLIIKGEGSFIVEGNRYSIFPNSLMVLRPGEMHRAEIKAGCMYERCYLHFYEDTVLQLDPEKKLLLPLCYRPIGQDNYYSPDSVDSAFIKSCMLKIDDIYSDDKANKDHINHYLFVILNEISKSFKPMNMSNIHHLGYDSQIYEIIKYINDNLCNDLTVDMIVKLFYISRPALNERFKNATGTTVWDYIITKRIILADQMIKSGEPATQAAYACGYNDYSSFYSAYMKKFKHPPKQ